MNTFFYICLYHKTEIESGEHKVLTFTAVLLSTAEAFS